MIFSFLHQLMDGGLEIFLFKFLSAFLLAQIVMVHKQINVGDVLKKYIKNLKNAFAIKVIILSMILLAILLTVHLVLFAPILALLVKILQESVLHALLDHCSLMILVYLLQLALAYLQQKINFAIRIKK